MLISAVPTLIERLCQRPLLRLTVCPAESLVPLLWITVTFSLSSNTRKILFESAANRLLLKIVLNWNDSLNVDLLSWTLSKEVSLNSRDVMFWQCNPAKPAAHSQVKVKLCEFGLHVPLFKQGLYGSHNEFSHPFPLKPGRQVQLKSAIKSPHVPLLWQGPEEHSSISLEQVFPKWHNKTEVEISFNSLKLPLKIQNR